jgi:hypothetical protein
MSTLIKFHTKNSPLKCINKSLGAYGLPSDLVK